MNPALPALAVLLAAAPAPALTLGELAGRWRGEGAYVIGAEPAQRLRCQMRGTPAPRGVVVLVGRCATAQGGQSFAWALIPQGEGRILAEDRSPTTGETVTTASHAGRIGPGGLRFDTDDGASFELSAETGGLVLRLAGLDQGRPMRVEARMIPEN